MALPEKPEGAIPLYNDTADNPNRVQIGWFRPDPNDPSVGVGDLFLYDEIAHKLASQPHNLSIYTK